MAYTHLSLEERHYIELQLKEGVSQNKIAGKNRDTQKLKRTSVQKQATLCPIPETPTNIARTGLSFDK